MVHLILMLNTMKILMKNDINLMLVNMSEYQNAKKFLLKDIRQISQKKFLLLAKLKARFHGLMLLLT